MNYATEPITENGTCKRCGRRGNILSNGLCSRCDNVLYGHHESHEKDYSPWYPKQIPPVLYPQFPRKRSVWWD